MCLYTGLNQNGSAQESDEDETTRHIDAVIKTMKAEKKQSCLLRRNKYAEEDAKECRERKNKVRKGPVSDLVRRIR